MKIINNKIVENLNLNTHDNLNKSYINEDFLTYCLDELPRV